MVISQNNNNKSSERTEVLHGEENVMNAILQFLSKAYRIDSCGDHRAPSVAIGVEEYKELLLDLKNRGTKLRFITDITKENIHYCKQVMKFAEEVRHIDGIKANFFVSETEYVATAARQESLPVPQVIYSNVKDIVVQQQYVFEAFWNRAIFADQKIREIEEGVDFGKTEIIQDSYAAKELFINMVRSAVDEILLIIPTVNAFYREERIGLIHLVREAAEQRGVKVKVLIPSSDVIEKIFQKSARGEEKEEKQKKFEIRRIDLTSEIKSTILVIDRKASLVTELRDDSKENFVQAIGLTSYSTSKPTVLSYTSIFENFWKQVELYEQLKIHDRMQKEFINVAAHELRSPIQPILGLSEVLKSKEGNIKEYNELIDVISRNAKRLRQLTEDILDVARIEAKLLWLTWQLTKQAATKSVTAMATLSSVSSSATSVTILLLLLTIIIAGVTINTQTASAVAWSKEFEDWLNRDGASYAVFCEGSLRLHQYISLVGDPQIIKLHNQVLGECDNNLLIIFKDVCPSHDNGFKVCGEPMVYQYLSERGLLSAKAPMEWKASTPEEQAAADALLRNFINRLH